MTIIHLSLQKNDEKLKALLVNSGQNFYEIDNFNDHLDNDESFDWILNLWGAYFRK